MKELFLLILLLNTLTWPLLVRADEKSIAKLEEKSQADEPFSFADFSWVPGNYAPPDSALKTKYFTPELRLDTAYHTSFAHPKDHTISGSTEAFRSSELQITHIGVGGDFMYNQVGFRLMTQFGMYSTTTPRNDASPSRGQWSLDNAYRYISEAYGTYHLNVMNGINIQAGIFMSYLGLWSYYNFDNWTYQPSYVSSNTPWYFNGIRVQIFPSEKLKIEPWLINGWQSYGMFNEQPGIGLQVLYRPNGWLSILGNQYYGADSVNSNYTPAGSTQFGNNRQRFHTDDSIMVKYLDNPDETLNKAAASLTLDAGCEFQGDTTCGRSHFMGVMAYNRFWFDYDHFGFTLGGGAINNPGRYLVLTPPINGATAFSGTPYFTQNPGDPFWAWDMQLTSDYMPNRNITFRLEFNHRFASVPYFSGSQGITPPGGNRGIPGSAIPGWSPDLTTTENRITAAFLVRL